MFSEQTQSSILSEVCVCVPLFAKCLLLFWINVQFSEYCWTIASIEGFNRLRTLNTSSVSQSGCQVCTVSNLAFRSLQ